MTNATNELGRNGGANVNEPGRVFDAGRKAQGFKSQAHLDAFYRAYDHSSSCAACKALDGYALLDDGYQPTSGRCPEGRRLDELARVDWRAPADFAIGERVRSFDFPDLDGHPGRSDCYVEGPIVAFEEREGCMRYVILVEVDAFDGAVYRTGDGKRSRVGRTCYPPVNGTPTTFGGVCQGVKAAPQN